MKKLTALGAIAIAVACVGNAFGGQIYWVSPSENPFPGWQGVTTADKTFTTIKAALADSELADGDTILLDKCTFDLSYANRSTIGDISVTTSITKGITITGVGTKDETIVDGGEEYSGGRHWNGKNHYPSFNVATNNVTFKNMTFTRMGSQAMPNIKMANNITGCVISNMVFRDTGVGYAASTWSGINGLITGSANGTYIISGCQFTGNTFPCPIINTTSGAAGTRIENCYVANNTCTGTKSNYGVIYATFGTSSNQGWLRNNTIVNNKSAIGAVYHGSANCRIVNNIIYGNTDLDGVGPKDVYQGGGAVSLWTYNCIGEGNTVYTGDGNIFKNPFLADDNMHLSSSSPCISTGSATYAPAIDLEGVARDTSKPCMGCCEYLVKTTYTCAIAATSEKVTLPTTVTLSVKITGTPVGELTYAWDFDGDGVVDATTATATLNKEGRYNVSLVVRDNGGSGDPVFATYNKIFVYGAGKSNFTWYVSPSGNGKNPVAGFATGYTTIKAALADADLADGDTILLDTCRFDMTDYRGDISTRKDAITKRITISGAGTKEQTILDGGTEYNRRNSGQGQFYPQFYVNANGVTIQNMTLERMGSNGDAAIEVVNGKTDCVISNIIIRKTGWGYTSRTNGKGHINAGNQNTKVMCSVFSNNCTSCSLVYLQGSANAGIENCYFSENSCIGTDSKSYNGVVCTYGGCICNNTVVNNKTVAGAFCHNGGTIVNNIIYGNTDLNGDGPKDVQQGSGSVANWTYNCIGEGSSVYTGAGNVFVDPNLADDNMHLKAGSICIGSADPAYAPAYDIEGVQRNAEKPSMGCSEFVGKISFTCAINGPETPYVCEPETITLSVTIVGDAVAPLTYAWDLDGDGVPDADTAEVELSDVGEYTVSVVVTDSNGTGASAAHDSKLLVCPENKTFYAAPANVNAQAPYATLETAGAFTDVYTLASKFSGSTIVMDDGIFNVRESGYEIGNGMKITSKSGRDKTIITTTGRGQGYKMFKLTDASSSVEGVTLTYKRGEAWTSGAAFYVTAGEVRDCQITNFMNKGSMVELVGSAEHPARLDRTIIKDCSYNGNGPAWAVTVGNNGYGVIENCLVASNNCPYINGKNQSSAIYTSSASKSTIVRNCTIVDNRGAEDAVPVRFLTKPTLFENNIVSGNTTNGTAVACNDLTYHYYDYVKTDIEGFVRNTCIYPADQARDYSAVTNLITVAPGFVDAANGDYHLRRDADFRSSCIGKGVNNGVYDNASIDLDGNKRLKGAGRKVDMGCYENQTEYGTQMILR